MKIRSNFYLLFMGKAYRLSEYIDTQYTLLFKIDRIIPKFFYKTNFSCRMYFPIQNPRASVSLKYREVKKQRTALTLVKNVGLIYYTKSKKMFSPIP